MDALTRASLSLAILLAAPQAYALTLTNAVVDLDATPPTVTLYDFGDEFGPTPGRVWQVVEGDPVELVVVSWDTGNVVAELAATATGDYGVAVKPNGASLSTFPLSISAPQNQNPDPPCFHNSYRFVDCGNGTVTDTATGLIWLQDASCVLPALGNEVGDYRDANEAVASLQDGDCGLTDNSSPGDWHLPTLEQWQVIVDQASANLCSAPFFPDRLGTGCCGTGTCLFTDIKSSDYWSATTFAPTPAGAWSAFLDTGNMVGALKSVSRFVWPVRTGP